MSTNLKNYLVKCIDMTEYNNYKPRKKYVNETTIKLQFVFDIFLIEKGGEIQRTSIKKAFKSWLSGLPSVVNIPSYNNEILEIGKELGLLDKNCSVVEEDLFLMNWYTIVTNSFFDLFEQYKIR